MWFRFHRCRRKLRNLVQNLGGFNANFCIWWCYEVRKCASLRRKTNNEVTPGLQSIRTTILWMPLIPAQSHAGAFLHLLLTCRGQLWPEHSWTKWLNLTITLMWPAMMQIQHETSTSAAIRPERSWKVTRTDAQLTCFFFSSWNPPLTLTLPCFSPPAPKKCVDTDTADTEHSYPVPRNGTWRYHTKNWARKKKTLYRYVIYSSSSKTIPFWWASWNSHFVRLTVTQLGLSTRHSPTKCRWILCTLNIAGFFTDTLT